jgi:hypothetical protein
LWENHKVIIPTDSTTAKAYINKGTSRNKLVMEALRSLFWLSIAYNFEIKAVHLPGHLNIVADAISRLGTPGSILQTHSVLRTASCGSNKELIPFVDNMHNHMSSKTWLHLHPQVLASKALSDPSTIKYHSTGR